MNLPDAPQVYRISPELRRSAWYVFIGYFVCVTATYYVVPRPGPFAWGPAIAGPLAAYLAKACVLRWRLTMDVDGITRHRFLIGADHWSWEDFASGKILKVYPAKLVDRQRPWWRRTLNLGHLDGQDSTAVTQAINQHYQLPEAADLPETLDLRYGFRRRVAFSWRGINRQIKGQLREYLWHDVQRVRVERHDPLRHDFQTLVIFLPNETIELRMLNTQSGPAPSWRGASAEVVSEFLRQYVPPEYWDEDVVGQRPAKAIDIERELEKCAKQIREWNIMHGVFAAMFSGLAIWTIVDEPRMLLFLGCNLLYILPFLWWIRRRFIRNRETLVSWLEEAHQEEQQKSLYA